jgi:hypothetical protein
VTHPYDPRRLLKQISNSLLRALFARHGVLRDLPWESFSEAKVEPVLAAWQALPDDKRREIQVALQDIHALADGRALKICLEEIQRRWSHRTWEFTSLTGRHDKALWAYLEFPDAFRQAALFARADALEGGRYWVKRNSLPRGPFAVDRGHVSGLERELHDHYWPTEMRGEHCRVEHYDRGNGAQYFYAYLDDWPDKRLVFTDGGELEPRSERFAFSNVFVFDPEEGSLELVAKGGAAAHLVLQQAFCRSVLGLEVGPAEPLRPAYRLDMLLQPGFAFVTDPADRIAQVFLRCVRIGSATVAGHAVDYLEMKFSAETELAAVVESIRHCVDQAGGDAAVRRATFELVFLPDAEQCAKRMSFSVTVPSTCNLKSKPEELRLVGERCLQLWGITDA